MLLTANDDDMLECIVRAAIASKQAEWPMEDCPGWPTRPSRSVWYLTTTLRTSSPTRSRHQLARAALPARTAASGNTGGAVAGAALLIILVVALRDT